MSANGISHLTNKSLRQTEKLALAAIDRTAAGNARDTLTISQLPTLYGTPNTAPLVDNPNAGGLVTGRPWV